MYTGWIFDLAYAFNMSRAREIVGYKSVSQKLRAHGFYYSPNISPAGATGYQTKQIGASSNEPHHHGIH